MGVKSVAGYDGPAWFANLLCPSCGGTWGRLLGTSVPQFPSLFKMGLQCHLHRRAAERATCDDIDNVQL